MRFKRIETFPAGYRRGLQGIQGRLIVPAEVDGHRDTYGTLLVVVPEVPIVYGHSTWRQSVWYPVRNCLDTMNRFPPRVRRDYFGRYYLSILSFRFPCWSYGITSLGAKQSVLCASVCTRQSRLNREDGLTNHLQTTNESPKIVRLSF